LSQVGFRGEEGLYQLWTKDVLNLGVLPGVLLEKARQRFEAAGGLVKELCPANGISVAPNGAAITMEGTTDTITSRLVIDCMGNLSPITRQARWGTKPDGICIVVGTCASGFAPENNTYADLLYADSPTYDRGTSQVQPFWEAFPASSGPDWRTTYMFAYMDSKPERPSILELFEDYWELMPPYQCKSNNKTPTTKSFARDEGIALSSNTRCMPRSDALSATAVDVSKLTFHRAVCNFFPTYKDSPLKTPFDRVCAVGDGEHGLPYLSPSISHKSWQRRMLILFTLLGCWQLRGFNLLCPLVGSAH